MAGVGADIGVLGRRTVTGKGKNAIHKLHVNL